MARDLTPAEWAELERAQREGGIPNVAPDSSVPFQAVPNAWGDLPSQSEQDAFRQRTTGYPQGGAGGILNRAVEGVERDIGQLKDKAVGLLGQVDWPDRIRGGYETADIPTEEEPDWLSVEWMSKETGLSTAASEFFMKFSDALEDNREDAQTIFNQWWPYLSPKDRDQLNVHLNILPPVEYGLAP